MTTSNGLIPLLVRARAAGQAHRTIEEQVSTLLRQVRLTTPRCLVLEALDRCPDHGASIIEIAKFLGVHRTSASAAIDHLQTAGLVTKDVDNQDARKLLVRITAAGTRQLATARELLTAQRHD